MKSREQTVWFIIAQLSGPGPPEKPWGRYGMVELRELLDWLYDGPPETPEQVLKRERWHVTG